MKAPLISELKARRQAFGWSVKELGERCNIDEKLLTAWEEGVGLPRLDAAESWAAALGLALGLAAGSDNTRAGVRVDWDQHRITVDGTPVRLTPMEWKALERLAKVPGELVTHQALFRHLYGDDQPYRVESTAIRVLITKLRRLLPVRIEARWGRGYFVSGIVPPSPDMPSGCAVLEDAATPAPASAPEPMRGKSRRDSIALVPNSVMRDAIPALRDRPEISYPSLRRVAPAPVGPSPCRAEELGVIEQFLAERGVTRCPDVATIQRSPLLTLVWDKIKRKWVRPPQPDREAS
jgi:transcriptional regulator with XRE-family HTH domain